jgi:hypothetical protein
MRILDVLENCLTWRDLYSLGEVFLEHGLLLTSTINNNRVLCAIREGKIAQKTLFNDYIFVEGKESDYIEDRSREVLIKFIKENASSNRLQHNLVNYQDKIRFYGKPIAIAENIDNQQIEYISRIIGD